MLAPAGKTGEGGATFTSGSATASVVVQNSWVARELADPNRARLLPLRPVDSACVAIRSRNSLSAPSQNPDKRGPGSPVLSQVLFWMFGQSATTTAAMLLRRSMRPGAAMLAGELQLSLCTY